MKEPSRWPPIASSKTTSADVWKRWRLTGTDLFAPVVALFGFNFAPLRLCAREFFFTQRRKGSQRRKEESSLPRTQCLRGRSCELAPNHSLSSDRWGSPYNYCFAHSTTRSTHSFIGLYKIAWPVPIFRTTSLCL